MTDKTPYSCYIDESGDEGFNIGKSSEWFFLAAVIMRESDEAIARDGLGAIRQRIWRNLGQTPPAVVHWERLKAEQRLAQAQEIAGLPITVCAVGMWKYELDTARPTGIRCQEGLFNFTSRLLLERVSWFVHGAGGTLTNVVFSSRGRLRKNVLTHYLAYIMSTRGCQIRPVLQPEAIKVRAPDQYELLQIADGCVSAVGAAFRNDAYGNVHPEYVERLLPRFYRRRGNLSRYGLKLFPRTLEDAALRARYPFTTQWR